MSASWRWIASATCVVFLVACGGNSSNAGKSASTTTTVESAEARAWVSAATTGLLSDPQRPKDLTPAKARCMAHALVDTITVARLTAAGTTLTDLSDPNKNLPPGVAASTPGSVKAAFGAALQACDVGRLLGVTFAQGLADGIQGGYRADANGTRCVALWFAAPAQRVVLANLLLHSELSMDDDQQLAGLMLDCLDFAQMLAPSMHLTFSTPERACIDTQARNDPELRAALAAKMHGGTANDVFAGFGLRIVRCLTRAHIAELRARGKPVSA